MRRWLSASMICLAVCCKAATPPPLTPDELAAAAARINAAMTEVRTREEERHKQLKHAKPLPPLPPRAGDETFLRRACVDLAGRLPQAHEVREFVADKADDKRANLIDRLLLEPGAAEVRFSQMAEALRVKDVVGGKTQEPFIQWLRQAVADDMPYDQLMAAMLRAEGSVDDNPAAGMWRRDDGNMMRTSMELAEAFLGVKLYCAHCHDHPFNDYTQRQTYEFANCFYLADRPAARDKSEPKTLLPGAIRIGPGNKRSAVENAAAGIPLPRNYKYRNGKPGEVLAPRFLPLGNELPPNSLPSFAAAPPRGPHLREGLVQWFTGPQNDRFAQVGALRQWRHLFGAFGQVYCFRESDDASEPYHQGIEMIGCDMPPTWTGMPWEEHLFERDFLGAAATVALGREFQRCGYRMREFQRILARTEAYQREARLRDPWRAAPVAAPMVRRLPSDVIWNAWTSWLPERAAAPAQVPEDSHPLHLLGRGKREWADESRLAISHRLAGFMLSDPLLKQVAVSPKLAPVSGKSTARVENLFLDILGRFPLDAERAAALKHLSANPKTGAADVAWALLNTSEFLFQQ